MARRPSPMIALLLGGTTLALISIVLIVGFTRRAPGLTSVSPPPARATLIDIDRLAANGLLGQIGAAPFESFRDDVLAQARRALQRDPHPGPLPEAVGDLRDDGKAALALAVASVLGADARHARAAAAYLDAWATTGTIDDVCLQSECDRAWRISRDLPAFVFAADLIGGPAAMNDEQTTRFADWLRLMRPSGPRDDGLRGDADVLARIVVGAYLDDDAAFDSAVREWRARLDLLEADGRLTSTANSESPIADTQEALTYTLLAADIAADRGHDLLTATGRSGASVRTAVDYLADHWAKPELWPGSGNASRPPAGALWEIAYGLWPDDDYLPMLTEYRSSGGGDLVAVRWSTLFGTTVTTTAMSTDEPSPGMTAPVASPQPTVMPTVTPAPTRTPRPGPLTQVPTIEFRLGATRADRALVRVSWPLGDRSSGDRSALSYRLESAIDDDAYDTLADGPRRRADTSLAPDHHHRFRVRASTEAAGVGPWSDELDVDLRGYEDTHRAIGYTGAWSSASSRTFSDGRVRYSTDRGATIELKFHGRAVAVRGPIGPTRGEADVIVDGQTVGRIDLGAPDFVGSFVVFEQSWAMDGDHTIALRVVGTPGRRVVAVDSITTLDGGA